MNNLGNDMEQYNDIKNKKLNLNRNLFIISFIVLMALFRFIPHLPNFTPITAIALFGGVYFNDKKLAFIIPIMIMLLSDLFLGFSSVTIFVYTAFIFVGYIGTLIKKLNLKSILISSLSFFIITNFGVWLLSYPKTLDGLMQCYSLAIPFFRNSLLADLFYAGVMYFGFEFISNKLLILKKGN